MSISSAMQAGVSGLMSNSSALAAISDNIANINTTAYKRTQVNFSDIVTAQALKNRYSAGGVQGTVRQYVSQQGLIQAANSSTDLAISGMASSSSPTRAPVLRPPIPGASPGPVASASIPPAIWSMTPNSISRAGPRRPMAPSSPMLLT